MAITRVPTQVMPDTEVVAYTEDKDFIPLSVGFYPGGEPMIKEIPDSIDSIIVRPRVGRSTLHPSLMESLLAALFLIDVGWDRGYPGVNLVLPYFPGARQDRINEDGDLLFTARSVARLIGSVSNINAVKILDPHSDVTPALLSNWSVEVFDASFVWGPDQDWSGWDYDGVIAPDSGAVKRAMKVAQLLNVDTVLHGWKSRSVATGELNGFGLQEPRRSATPGHYLVVDDICDGGATFLGLAGEIRARGLTADLFVTHGIFSSPGNLYMLKRNYKNIYCSDSVLVSDEARADGVHVIPVVERML